MTVKQYTAERQFLSTSVIVDFFREKFRQGFRRLPGISSACPRDLAANLAKTMFVHV